MENLSQAYERDAYEFIGEDTDVMHILPRYYATMGIDRLEEKLKQKILDIEIAAKCEDSIFFISDKANFRRDIATIAPYKEGRGPKPIHFKDLLEFSIETFKPVIVANLEADDVIAMTQVGETVICSRDKDFDTVPGWHYRWACGENQPERPLYNVTQEEANHFFFTQVLTGDGVDNIKGVKGIGVKRAAGILEDVSTIQDMYKVVLDKYREVYDEDGLKFMNENANLLHLTRNLHKDGSPVLWEDEIIKWLT